MSDQLVNKYLNIQSKIAVVGATIKEEKYGFQILQVLKERGFQVFPVNPKYSEILGISTFSTLDQINVPIDIINFVILPSVGLKIIQSLDLERYKDSLFWFQPGAESDSISKYLASKNIKFLIHHCIMVEASKISNKK